MLFLSSPTYFLFPSLPPQQLLTPTHDHQSCPFKCYIISTCVFIPECLLYESCIAFFLLA